MDDASNQTFFTDRQLQERWQCSQMKLWRMRKRGTLISIKLGGIGVNLTPMSHVLELEIPKEKADAA